MNDDTINDLKQFIATTVSQQTSDIRSDMAKMEERLENKIGDLSASIGEALDTSNEEVGTQLKDHERRIVILEQKPA